MQMILDVNLDEPDETLKNYVSNYFVSKGISMYEK